jgi:hypothetical protein
MIVFYFYIPSLSAPDHHDSILFFAAGDSEAAKKVL